MYSPCIRVVWPTELLAAGRSVQYLAGVQLYSVHHCHCTEADKQQSWYPGSVPVPWLPEQDSSPPHPNPHLLVDSFYQIQQIKMVSSEVTIGASLCRIFMISELLHGSCSCVFNKIELFELFFQKSILQSLTLRVFSSKMGPKLCIRIPQFSRNAT